MPDCRSVASWWKAELREEEVELDWLEEETGCAGGCMAAKSACA